MSGDRQPRVLITGASGLLGWSLLREFRGWEILAPDLDEFDILRKAQTAAYIEEAKPNLVIHAAAYTAVDKAEAEPEAALAVNGLGTEAVAEGALRAAACLVYISTDYLFDGRKGRPYDERDQPHPQGSYARSKLAGEEAVRRILEHFLIVRTAWIFGPGRPNFVSQMAKRAEGGERVRVVNDQVGSPTYTPHLAAAIRRLWELRVPGTVNVVNSGSCSWFELTREIYRLAGASPDLVSPQTTAELNRPAPRPAYSVLSTEKYQWMTGESLPDWKDALREYFSRREDWEG